MKIQIPSLFLGVLLCALAVVAPTAGADVFPYDVHETTLDNGLKVLLVPMPSEGLVTYWSIVRTGSRDEVEEGVTGFAHFFEHMMFRGSEMFPQEVRESIVATMGADANAYTTDDLTAYYLSMTAEDLPKVIELESDRFQNLKYEEAVFRTEAGAVYGEYRKNKTNPFFALYEGMLEEAYDAHTYQHTTIGYEADIQQMPEQYEYSKSFFDRFYRPENIVIFVAGDFDVDTTLAQIRQGYGAWKPGYQAPKVQPEPEQTAQRRTEIAFEGQTLPLMSVAFKGAAYQPDDISMVAGSLVGELAFGATSPLFKKLVLQEQRLQFLSPDFGFNRDPGLWVVYSMINDGADVRSVEGEIFATISGLQAEPVSQERLDDVRSAVKYGFLSDLATPDQVASNLARLIALTGGIDAVNAYFETLEKITPKDIQRAAKTYLTPARSTVSVLYPEGQPLPEPSSAAEPVLMPVAQDPNVAFRLWFQVGSQNDPAGREGLAYMTASLLSQGGTETQSYEQVLDALAPLAAGYDASVDKEMTVVTGQVHRDLVDRFYPLYLDAVLRPVFSPEDFERVKTQTLTLLEKQLRYSSDEELGKATLYNEVFEGTPYGHLALGTVESLKAMTLDDVKDFYRRFYTQDKVVVALGGAYPEGMEARLLADLGRLPKAESAPEEVPSPQPQAIEGRQVVIVEKPGNSTAISFGYPLDVHRGSREFYALWIANSWLGEHRNSISHLYQVIREERGMNYGDYSYIEVFPNGGSRNMPPTGVGRREQLFEVWIRPVPDENAVFALRAALRELDKLIADGLTPEQFEAQKGFLSKYVLQFATTTGERLGYAVDDRYYGIEGEGHLAHFRQKMDEITLDEVNAAVKKYLQTDDLVIALITADAEALKQALVSDAPSPIDYGAVEKPADVLAEDKEIERYPLGIEAGNLTIVPVDEMFER